MKSVHGGTLRYEWYLRFRAVLLSPCWPEQFVQWAGARLFACSLCVLLLVCQQTCNWQLLLLTPYVAGLRDLKKKVKTKESPTSSPASGASPKVGSISAPLSKALCSSQASVTMGAKWAAVVWGRNRHVCIFYILQHWPDTWVMRVLFPTVQSFPSFSSPASRVRACRYVRD